uniref:Uncharacterized protein n=1 Tax=Arundo donax TaxID=35708 RepID=A0A0A8Y2K8_ARUDO
MYVALGCKSWMKPSCITFLPSYSCYLCSFIIND